MSTEIDTIIAGAGLLVFLIGVYLLIGLAVALMGLGAAMMFIGIRMKEAKEHESNQTIVS